MCPYHPAMLTLAHSIEPFALIHWSQVRMTHGFLNWHTSPTHALQCQSYHTTYDCKMILNRMIHQQHLKHPAVRFSGGITWLNLFRQFVWNSKSEKHMKRPRFGRNSDYISISNQKCVSFEIMTTLFPNQKFWFQKLKFQIRNSDSDSKNKQMIPDLKLWFQTKNSDAKWKEMFLEFYLGIRNANANMSLSHNICSNLQGGIKNSNIQTFEHTFCKTASWNQNFWFPSERISDSISRNLLAPS